MAAHTFAGVSLVALSATLSGCGSESCHHVLNDVPADQVTVGEFCDACGDCSGASDDVGDAGISDKTACIALQQIIGSCPSASLKALSNLDAKEVQTWQLKQSNVGTAMKAGRLEMMNSTLPRPSVRAMVAEAKTMEAKNTVAGACTSDEASALSDPKAVGDQANTCGTSSYNILTGNFNHDKFNSCFTAAMGISTACSECYAVTGEYGAKNCKADCLLGWCKSGCLSCTAPAQTTLATCTGFAAGTADPCEEDVTV